MNNTRNLVLQTWVNEMKNLSHLRHPNMLTPIGYSFNTHTNVMILVYEFMPKGSLNKHLFGGLQPLPLSWETRIKVALGAARALAFLHDLEPPVMYRVFRSDNIILDGDFNAKLSDTGLLKDVSKYGIEGRHGIVNGVRVMYFTYFEPDCVAELWDIDPYAAPEYIVAGELSELSTKCNVYNFGVVLVELISGLRALDRNRPAGEHNLMDWAKPYLGKKGQQSMIMNIKLQNEYPHKEAYKVGKIALQCTSLDPRSRPRMAEVVAALQQL